MIEIKDFKPRLYQESILKTAINKNTLVVLPTGIGKTFISLLLAEDRLNKFPNSKVLVLTPTKPLSNQFKEVFKKHTNIDNIVLLTGAIKPSERSRLWQEATVIVATPQTIQKDLENNRISLENISLLTIDEAHRSRMKYANTIVAKNYLNKSKFSRILALTASPGSSKERINEIKDNLGIEAIEIRTEDDEELKPYIQKRNIEWVNVDLTEDFQKLRVLIKKVYKEKIKSLKKFGFTKPSSLINKKDLILLQMQFRKELNKKNPIAYSGISMTAQLMKLDYALELLETQGLVPLKEFLSKLENEDTKAAKIIIKTKEIQNAINIINNLINKKIKHPKLMKLLGIVEELLNKNPETKIIIFANYRNTVHNIVNNLNEIQKARPIELLGQKEGITQKKQLEAIKEFESGNYNCLVGTSIGEEGLDIKKVGVAIFYDCVPSEIRKIQRMGRVARLEKGKIIFLITKNSRDQAYYWSAYRKEMIMRKTLYSMQENKSKKINLFDYEDV